MQPSSHNPTLDDLLAEIAELRARLEDAEQPGSEGEPLSPNPVSDLPRGDAPVPMAPADRRPVVRAMLHDLAQPLNTIACYAVAARNLANATSVDASALSAALRGIDQQVVQAGVALGRLRALFDDVQPKLAETSQGRGEAPGKG